MQEYFGGSAKNYKQPQDKFFTLFPALERLLPHATKGQTLADLACGTGDLYEFVLHKGYEYTGIDISEDMLAVAKKNHPQATFLKGDATHSLDSKAAFDVVLCNMLLPSIDSKNSFNSIFKTAYSMLKEDGFLLLSSAHPCFNGYMGKNFLNRTDIETDFRGYFSSGTHYQILRKFEDSDFVFNDYHWTLTDYFDAAQAAGFTLSQIDECNYVADTPKEIKSKIDAKGCPSFIVFLFMK